MGGEAIGSVRARLKTELWRERMDYEWGSPLCDVCGESLLWCDMHESIVRRGVARGWSKEDRLKIFVPYNCHLVHRHCHGLAHGNPELMVAIQICRYGWQHVMEWVASLPFKVFFAWDRGLDENTARTMVEGQAPWILRQK